MIDGVDAPITHGKLSVNKFNQNLKQSVNSDALAAHHAVLFTPDDGIYEDKTFLIIDVNGVAGYQRGQDLVVFLDHPTNLTHLSVHSFI